MHWRKISARGAAAALPTTIAGGCLGLLVLFLNPGAGLVGVDAVSLTAGYCLVGLAAGTVLVLPFVWRHPKRAAVYFPWAMTALLTVTAGYFVAHASRWAFYLPAATNRRLVFAGAVLFVLGLLCFYTALLHTVHQRPYSARSLCLVAACGLAALMIPAAILPASPRGPDPLPVTAPSVTEALPLVVIGLEGATLEVLLPMVEQGSLPQLGDWINEGVVAPVSTLKPPRPVALWTSIATGSWPFHHRALANRIYAAPWRGRQELRLLPEWLLFERWGLFGAAHREVRASDLERKPVWQVYRDVGLTAAVEGWPAMGEAPSQAAQPLPAATGDLVLVLVDALAGASQRYFGSWTRVRRGNRDPQVEREAAQLEAAYRRIDRQLAAWQATLPAERITAVVSAYGYGQPARWRRLIGQLAGGGGRGTARGGQDGVLILHGPGVRRGQRLPAVRLVDVMPTLVHSAGMPVAADLDGAVVTRAFAPEGLANRPLTFVPSYQAWRTVMGDE